MTQTAAAGAGGQATAIALTFGIETIQLLVPALERAYESADVVDKLTGLAIGLGGGSWPGGS